MALPAKTWERRIQRYWIPGTFTYYPSDDVEAEDPTGPWLEIWPVDSVTFKKVTLLGAGPLLIPPNCVTITRVFDAHLFPTVLVTSFEMMEAVGQLNYKIIANLDDDLPTFNGALGEWMLRVTDKFPYLDHRGGIGIGGQVDAL